MDAAVTRLLTLRFRTGMFDPIEDQPYAQLGGESVGTAAHAAVAYEGAVQGMVLLKNARNALPLTAGVKVAVVGPEANYSQAMMGDNYAGA